MYRRVVCDDPTMGRASRAKRNRRATNDASGDHVLAYHLVGFFDVLGQSSRLRHLTRLPQTDEERAATLRLLKDTAGTVIGLRRMFRDLFIALESPTAFVRSLPHDQQRQVTAATQANLTHWGVSDSIIVAVSLRDDQHPCTPVNGVYRALVAAAGMWLLSLSISHPLRGGIDVGLGINVGDREIYGPALDRAYKLESTLAQGPRIVVGEECLHYLNAQLERQTAGDLNERLAAAVAAFCLSMLRRDTDGTVVLDPLGERMVEMARTMARFGDSNIADRIAPAHEVVRQQLSRAKASNDQKLIARYQTLLEYFDQRVSSWT
jgi:hypothetical protein